MAPPLVGDWLALVGDDSGTEVLPGVKGIGAKGATTLLEEHGTITEALAKLETLEGRLPKALRASHDDVVRELARARLDRTRALPVALDQLAYVAPEVKPLNALPDMNQECVREADEERRAETELLAPPIPCQ